MNSGGRRLRRIKPAGMKGGAVRGKMDATGRRQASPGQLASATPAANNKHSGE